MESPQQKEDREIGDEIAKNIRHIRMYMPHETPPTEEENKKFNGVLIVWLIAAGIAWGAIILWAIRLIK